MYFDPFGYLLRFCSFFLCTRALEVVWLHVMLAGVFQKRGHVLHPDLAVILPGAAEVDELQKRVLRAYNDENRLPPRWNGQLRGMI